MTWTAYDARALREFKGSFEDLMDVLDQSNLAIFKIWQVADDEVKEVINEEITPRLQDSIGEIRWQIRRINDALAETDEARAERDAEREAQERIVL